MRLCQDYWHSLIIKFLVHDVAVSKTFCIFAPAFNNECH